MADVWARDADIRCLHPGAHPLLGRDQVLASWREIFSHSAPGSISFQVRETALIGGIGLVCCFEAVNGHFGIATNLFIKEGTLWRMIHHQAGPIAAPPRQAVPEVPPRPN